MYKQDGKNFYTDEERIIEILDNYCAHRSIFWNAFYGWKGLDKNNINTFHIPNWRHFEKLRLEIEG